MRATAKLFGENAVAAIASEIEGSVAQVIYRSAKTAYTVLEVKVGRIAAGEGRKMSKVRKVTVVGHCSALEEGCFVRASGEWVESPRHGLQLRASSIAQVTPKSSDACKRYLRNFARVGPKRAKLLVEA
jgi:exodeoxyribonuclease V alpha subunit